VEQAVDAAEIDERAVLGEVLDDPLDDLPFLEALERLALELGALLLEQHAAGQDDVAALLVELDDLELVVLADERVQVADGAEIDLRAGEERLHAAADRDGQAPLHPLRDRPLDQLVALARGGDLVPHLEPVGLLLGEHAQPVLVLARLEQDVDLVARLDADLSVGHDELGQRDLPLGLVADVDDHVVLGDLDDRPGDDLPFLHHFVLQALFEERGERLLVAAKLLFRLQSPAPFLLASCCFAEGWIFPASRGDPGRKNGRWNTP
jgi:hypothetical protein